MGFTQTGQVVGTQVNVGTDGSDCDGDVLPVEFIKTEYMKIYRRLRPKLDVAVAQNATIEAGLIAARISGMRVLMIALDINVLDLEGDG